MSLRLILVYLSIYMFDLYQWRKNLLFLNNRFMSFLEVGEFDRLMWEGYERNMILGMDVNIGSF